MNVPIRLMVIVRVKCASGWTPSFGSTRSATAIPAAHTRPWTAPNVSTRSVDRALHLRVAGDVGPDEVRARAVLSGLRGAGLLVDVDDHGAAARRDDHVHGGAAKT